MVNKYKIRKILLFALCLFSTMALIGCGSEESTVVELTPEQKLEAQLTNIVNSPYVEAIKQSRIVNPLAIINSFNKNLTESIEVFNNTFLAVEVTYEDLLYGRVFIDGDSSDGYYCSFTEGFTDEKTDSNKTNFVISIAKEDYTYISYGTDRVVEEEVVNSETGEVKKVKKTIPKIIESYFLVGKINKIVGDQKNGDEKINIVMENARLVPATTYKELVVEDSKNIGNAIILDTNSGENITQTTHRYKFGKYDFDDDGICDELIVQIDEYTPESSLDKLIRSNILLKIKTPISTYIQALYGDNTKLGTFKVEYPFKLKSLTAGECTSFDGSYSNYLKLTFDGFNISNVKIDDVLTKEVLFQNILKEDTGCYSLVGKDIFYAIDDTGVKELKVNLLNGETESASNPKNILLRNTKILMSGKIEGDNYIYTTYPFNLVYQPSICFYSDGYLKEEEADYYQFYSILGGANLDSKIKHKKISEIEDYQFVSNKNIYIAEEKYILESVELNSNSSYSSVETGTGRYYKTNANGDKELKTTKVFYSGSQKFKFCSLAKDSETDGLYWLEVLSESGKKGYIPIEMTGAWTDPNTQYEFYDNISKKSYSLFSDSGKSSIFTKIEEPLIFTFE